MLIKAVKFKMGFFLFVDKEKRWSLAHNVRHFKSIQIQKILIYNISFSNQVVID